MATPTGANTEISPLKGTVNGRKIHVISDKTLVRLDSFEVLAFAVEHDCPNMGFIVREKATGEYLLYVVDTCNITQRFKYSFSIVAIECSYDVDILRPRLEAGEVEEVYAKRLLTSHFEKQNCLKYLRKFVNTAKLRELHFLHLSGGNIDRKQLANETEQEFFLRPIFAGKK